MKILLLFLGSLFFAVPTSAAVAIEARKLPIRTEGGEIEGGVWNLWSNGRVGGHFRFAQKGVYKISVRAYGSPAASEWPEMAILIDGLAEGTKTVDRKEAADYVFSVEIPAGGVELSVAFSNDFLTATEDRNLYLERIMIEPPTETTDPTPISAKSMAEEYERREEAVLAKAKEDIEKYRKAKAAIRLTDSAGKPLAGAKIGVELARHEFLFGCNIYEFDRFDDPRDNELYKKRFEQLFNYATTGFYWRWYEVERGKPDYAFTDKVTAWCRERGIELKGHPLLWGDEGGIPTWSEGQPSPDAQRKRVFDIMRRYGGDIRFWEVVNEPTLHREPKIDEPYRWAREADPRGYTIVNEAFVLADGRPVFLRLLEGAVRRDVPFDGIGIQAHEPKGMRFPLDRVQKILDRYAALGKQLHITEFTPTSGGEKIVGSHKQGVWNEAAQAEYAEKFYRVCFAHPAMRAITWWDFSDRNSWRTGGGMLRADLTPKPVYLALKRLIREEWNTRLEGKTDARGKLEFAGYFGEYRAKIEFDGKTFEQTFRLTKEKPEIALRID
jgi:GH35 family endo-1,4-beta-xylanase